MIDEGSGETDRMTVKISSDCAYTLITPPSKEMDLMGGGVLLSPLGRLLLLHALVVIQLEILLRGD